MRARSVDPRTASGLVDDPDFRVDFWDGSGASDEWLLEDVEDVSDVLTWSREHARGRSAVVYAQINDGTSVTLVRLSGSAPS